ncbi:C-type lectin domain family 4 member D isoform X2 [Acetobacter orientalis]|uniref:C-type lectin domain family 4 member D isoform X2 n=1 Tax=Acetobacter orientalis TaxID=146474 RepID=A0A2Z5ZGJ2_9PROT|nr:C-type lectin domain family 4 member D isoform X2 [Acetobacter orientalis]
MTAHSSGNKHAAALAHPHKTAACMCACQKLCNRLGQGFVCFIGWCV